MTAIFAFLQYLKVSISERHTIFSRSLLCLDQPAHHFCTMIEVRQFMPELWHKIWAQKLMTQIKKFWKCSERCQLKILFRKPPSLKVTFKSKFVMFRLATLLLKGPVTFFKTWFQKSQTYSFLWFWVCGWRQKSDV